MQQDNNIDIDCQDKIQEQVREEEKSSDLPLTELSPSQAEPLIDNACAADTPSRSNSVPGQNLSVTVKQNTNMMEYLAWPESPKRKRKRQIERFPYAITSREYQEMFEKKNLAKLNAEKEKERRRKEREEKKAAATTKKESRKSKTKPVCSICSNPKPNISCNSCKKCYHTKCIPKSHQQHEPDLEDNDLFL